MWQMREDSERPSFTGARFETAATSAGAELLGRSDLGSVAEGKSADFVVLDANPLDDIRNTRRISRVYLRGDEIDRPAMRARWEAQCAAAYGPRP